MYVLQFDQKVFYVQIISSFFLLFTFLGHSVEFLKSYVESEYGIPIQEQNMYLDDKRMLDPLSLLDYPQEKGADEMFIRVDGELPADSKK